MPRALGAAKCYLQVSCNNALSDSSHARAANELKIAERLEALLPRNSEKHAFSTSAKREGGHGFRRGPLSPNLGPHRTSAPKLPMDPWIFDGDISKMISLGRIRM